MLAIITGTVQPAEEMRQLAVRNISERLEQYRSSLTFFINSTAFSKIIFAENSNYGITEFEDLIPYAKNRGVQLEVLSFQGNTSQSTFHGKGYGEGEILKYVMESSELLKGEAFFVKITGRLQICNIKEIVQKLQPKRTYFNIPNRTKMDIYDTRVYAMPIAQFRDKFINAYTQVMDDEQVYLEHVYTQQIICNRIKVHNFPLYPRISGISGSSGVPYVYSEWKCKIRDLISKFNYYTIKNHVGRD